MKAHLVCERCLLRAQTKWAFIDLDSGRPTRIPAEVLAAFSLQQPASRSR